MLAQGKRALGRIDVMVSVPSLDRGETVGPWCDPRRVLQCARQTEEAAMGYTDVLLDDIRAQIQGSSGLTMVDLVSGLAAVGA